MEPWYVTIFLTLICSFAASTGFWAYLQKRSESKDLRTNMVLGLGHDRLVFLCMQYVARGSITSEEYENLHKYLYKPYKDLLGNGTVDKLMVLVDTLPIKGSIYSETKEEK